MIAGTPKFNGIAIGSLSANANRPTLHLEATAGFVDSKSGETYGWTKGDGQLWSRATMMKLRELMDSMEEDLAKRHFSDDGLRSSGSTKEVGLDVGGIAEHCNAEPVPSV